MSCCIVGHDYIRAARISREKTLCWCVGGDNASVNCNVLLLGECALNSVLLALSLPSGKDAFCYTITASLGKETRLS